MKLKILKINMFILFMLVMIFASFAAVHADSSTPAITVDLLNQNPDPARAGDIVTLKFQVQNFGASTANNLQLEVIEDYPFTVVSGNTTQTIDTLAANQNGDTASNIEFKVKIDKDAVRSIYPLRIRYKFNNNADWLISTFDINTQNKAYAQIVNVDTAHVDPGKEAVMNFTISNLGSAALQNIVFSWNEPTGILLPVYSDDTRYIKYLDVGQSVQVSYTVIADVNAKAGLYMMNLNLGYESVDNATSSKITTKAGVFVGGQTDFDVAFSESTAGQTSLSVANTGNNPASSVSISIPQQPDFSVSGSNSAIVGNLDKGDYTLVSFQIASRNAINGTGAGGQFNRTRQGGQTGAAATGTGTGGNFPARNNTADNPNNLRVLIQYTDTTGQRISVEKSVPINFRTSGTSTFSGRNGTAISSSTSFFTSTTFYVIIAVVVLVAGYFVYRRIKNKKKK